MTSFFGFGRHGFERKENLLVAARELEALLKKTQKILDVDTITLIEELKKIFKQHEALLKSHKLNQERDLQTILNSLEQYIGRDFEDRAREVNIPKTIGIIKELSNWELVLLRGTAVVIAIYSTKATETDEVLGEVTGSFKQKITSLLGTLREVRTEQEEPLFHNKAVMKDLIASASVIQEKSRAIAARIEVLQRLNKILLCLESINQKENVTHRLFIQNIQRLVPVDLSHLFEVKVEGQPFDVSVNTKSELSNKLTALIRGPWPKDFGSH